MEGVYAIQSKVIIGDHNTQICMMRDADLMRFLFSQQETIISLTNKVMELQQQLIESKIGKI